MFTIARVMGNVKSSTPETFWPLPGDPDQETVTEEEIEEIKRRFAEIKANG